VGDADGEADNVGETSEDSDICGWSS